MLKIIRNLVWHPLNRADPLGALMRFARWQVGTRLVEGAHIVPFVDQTVLVMERGMTGATGNYYCGLHEVSEMAFTLHFLRPGDLFVDVGANVGSYTILASGCAKADTICFEPIPDTFDRLMRNIRANRLDDRVAGQNIGIGSAEGELKFVSNLDTVNRVATEADTGSNVIGVMVKRLDDELACKHPCLMKIDVEGWETEVIKGMPKQLMQPELAAVIMETNEAASRYEERGRDELADLMAEAGFQPCTYDPFKRELLKGGSNVNTIFVRDFDKVRERTKSAGQFRLVNGAI